jgi:hypothetical protein
MSGLNAGTLPESGLTYANLTINYSADSLRDSKGNAVPVTGSYDVWAVLNMFYFVPKFKVLGGHFAVMAALPAVNGSLTAPQFGLSAGGSGFGDVWVQPAVLGWRFSRADTYAAYSFIAPTGRFVPGATDNIGSGYWGHHITIGTTVYLRKDRMTSANLTTDWEIHGQQEGTKITPGQAFTTEWGIGQIFPLDERYKKLLQVGLVGYDQWQVTANGGTFLGIPASLVPFYSVHAAGVQTNFMMPAKNLSIFFKYEPEYRALAHTHGRTIVFGASWTLRSERPKLPQP